MKNLILLFLLFFTGCEIYNEPTDPVLYLGGGKWTLTDYEIVTDQSISPLMIIKNDTICINSFFAVNETPQGILLKQNYFTTSLSRRFVVNKTQWEFDGYNLYVDWINTPGGMIPSHEPFWVTYPNYMMTESTRLSILDNITGSKTDYTFDVYNRGTMPPNKLTLVSPDIVINLYSSNGARDKAVIFHIVLTFTR